MSNYYNTLNEALRAVNMIDADLPRSITCGIDYDTTADGMAEKDGIMYRISIHRRPTGRYEEPVCYKA